MTAHVLALLLADSRLPTGGHAHSGGTEQAVDEGIVTDVATLGRWLDGRLATTIALEAHAAARACASAIASACDSHDVLHAALDELAAEVDARMASGAAREVSRRQGGQYLRAAARVLASTGIERRDSTPHLCVAIGVTAAAAGLQPDDAAGLATYQALASAAAAALRLLGLDPVDVAALVAARSGKSDALAARAAASAHERARLLPSLQAPALDWMLERHHARKERLFAS